MKLKKLWGLISQTFSKLTRDNVTMMAAALAYYTFFSFAPMLVIVIVIAGYFFDKSAIQNMIISQLGGFITEEGAQGVGIILAKFMNPKARYMASAIGITSLLLGASSVYLVLQNALNTIWETKNNIGNNIWKFFKIGFMSLGIILILVILFLILFIVSTVSNVVIAYSLELLPVTYYLWSTLNILTFLIIFTLIFGVIYKLLPNAEVNWNDVWPGAALASILFNIGRIIIGAYLVKSGLKSVYGAAGSIVMLLVWIFYTSYVFLLGAEFTKVYSGLYGSRSPHK